MQFAGVFRVHDGNRVENQLASGDEEKQSHEYLNEIVEVREFIHEDEPIPDQQRQDHDDADDRIQRVESQCHGFDLFADVNFDDRQNGEDDDVNQRVDHHDEVRPHGRWGDHALYGTGFDREERADEQGADHAASQSISSMQIVDRGRAQMPGDEARAQRIHERVHGVGEANERLGPYAVDKGGDTKASVEEKRDDARPERYPT